MATQSLRCQWISTKIQKAYGIDADTVDKCLGRDRTLSPSLPCSLPRLPVHLSNPLLSPSQLPYHSPF
jgi:hypothetical protein